jgi:uncharacterized membrane protein
MNLDRADITYLIVLAATLFAVWFFKVRKHAEQRESLRAWIVALGIIGGFMGLVLLVLKLAGY